MVINFEKIYAMLHLRSFYRIKLFVHNSKFNISNTFNGVLPDDRCIYTLPAGRIFNKAFIFQYFEDFGLY